MSESAGRVVAEIGPVYTLLWAGTESVASIVNRMGLKVGDKLVPESLWANAESRYSECWSDYGELLTERDALLSKLAAVRALADELAAKAESAKDDLDTRAEMAYDDAADRIRALIQTPTEAVEK